MPEVLRPADWNENANATNGVATATRTAPSDGQSHFITHVSASYSVLATTGLLTVTRQDGNLLLHVHGAVELDFPTPLRGGAGQLVSVSLADGGVGVEGRVNIAGYTR